MLESEPYVDFIAGPDAYRELPRILASCNSALAQRSTAFVVTKSDVRGSQLHREDANSASFGETMSMPGYEEGATGAGATSQMVWWSPPPIPTSASSEVRQDVVDVKDSLLQASTHLRMDETYADIRPVRVDEDRVHAFVTITRGCDNNCAFCIVPFVRGPERARPIESILGEIATLVESGYREIVLLGQNVNSYHYQGNERDEGDEIGTSGELATAEASSKKQYEMSAGFTVPTKNPKRALSATNFQGVLFEDLLRAAAHAHPEIRFRFQSPHPKDFPDSVLQLIASTPNICSALHMPAQHGASTVLERMKRGYSAKAYRDLIDRARKFIGNGESARLGLSSDFISGFCGETEEEHEALVALIEDVGFDQAFTYSYSERAQTHAGMFLNDDVPPDVKQRRLEEVISAFQHTSQARNARLELGRLHVVLVEGPAKTKGTEEEQGLMWTGRTDTNKRVVFPDCAVVAGPGVLSSADVVALRRAEDGKAALDITKSFVRATEAVVEARSFVLVKVVECRGHTLRAQALALTSISEAYRLHVHSL